MPLLLRKYKQANKERVTPYIKESTKDTTMIVTKFIETVEQFYS